MKIHIIKYDVHVAKQLKTKSGTIRESIHQGCSRFLNFQEKITNSNPKFTQFRNEKYEITLL